MQRCPWTASVVPVRSGWRAAWCVLTYPDPSLLSAGRSGSGYKHVKSLVNAAKEAVPNADVMAYVTDASAGYVMWCGVVWCGVVCGGWTPLGATM